MNLTYLILYRANVMMVNKSHDDGESKRWECKVVTTLSDLSWPERLPLCFGYESETSRPPQRRHRDPELHSEQWGEGHWNSGQVLRGKTQVNMRRGDKKRYHLLNKTTAFYISTVP